MNLNNCEINVLVKGRSITEFPHNEQVFIEGRAGSNYELEFRNKNYFRVEVILSVDGLSVTDGKVAGLHSSGYLVEANSVVRVPGWTLDSSSVAAFTFSADIGGSYVEQSTASSANKGVIGAMVFRENVPVPKSNPYGNFPGPFWTTRGSGGICASQNSFEAVVAASSITYDAYLSTISPVEQTLGTAFGDAAVFNTKTVSFDRGATVSLMTIYYDNAKNLVKRGIQLRKPPVPPVPQAFPGLGCVPPAGWVKKQ